MKNEDEMMLERMLREEAEKDYEDIDADFISLCLDICGEEYPSEETVEKGTDKILSLYEKKAVKKKPHRLIKLRKAMLVAAVVAVLSAFAAVTVTARYEIFQDNALFEFVQRKLDKKAGIKTDKTDENEEARSYRELFAYIYTLDYTLEELSGRNISDLLLPSMVRSEKMRSTQAVYFDEKYCTKAEFWQYDEEYYVTVRIRDYSENPAKLPDIESIRGEKAQRVESEGNNYYIWQEPNGRIMLEYIRGDYHYKISADCTFDFMIYQAKTVS